MNLPSISDGDFKVIDFLIAHCRERHTIRHIAKTLKLSPAGVHVSFKKLEHHHIVKSEKLGTGLFYQLNFSNRLAQHLASLVLISRDGQDKKTDATILLTSKTEMLEIGVQHTTPHQFIDNVREKDPKTLRLLKSGKVCKGELQLLQLLEQAII